MHPCQERETKVSRKCRVFADQGQPEAPTKKAIAFANRVRDKVTGR